MTATVRDIAERRMAVLYDGSNSADIHALITQFTIVSESAGTLTFTSAGSPFVAHTGEHIIFFQGMVFAVFDNSSYANFYTEMATWTDMGSVSTTVAGHTTMINANTASIATNTSNIAANTAAIAANAASLATLSSSLSTLSVAAVRSVGAAVVPTLLLGVAQNVAVTLNPTMPSAVYTPRARVWGGVSLTSVTINSVTATSSSIITVNLQTSLVSLVGVNLIVTATT